MDGSIGSQVYLNLGPYFIAVGLVLLLEGAVQLCVSKRMGLWKEGGATSLAGAIVVGVLIVLLYRQNLYVWLHWYFLIIGLILLFKGVVQLCVRKKTGTWKEGGASLLAGAIIVGVVASGVAVFEVWLYRLPEYWYFLWFCLFVAGLVLLFSGVVQFCVRKKTGIWKEGGASLLAGAIVAGGCWGSAYFTGVIRVWSGFLFMDLILAGVFLAFNGVGQLCVRNKAGLWKEAGGSLLGGAIGCLMGIVLMTGYPRIPVG